MHASRVRPTASIQDKEWVAQIAVCSTTLARTHMVISCACHVPRVASARHRRNSGGASRVRRSISCPRSLSNANSVFCPPTWCVQNRNAVGVMWTTVPRKTTRGADVRADAAHAICTDMWGLSRILWCCRVARQRAKTDTNCSMCIMARGM